MQAVILAGGKGTRLASRLNGRPKPLVDVDGIPLLARQLTQLAEQGVEEAVVLVNHAADQIEAYLSGRDFGCRVVLIDDGDPRGTAGAVLACLDRLQPRFLVVYGDTLFDLDIGAFLAAHAASGAAATLLLHPNDHPADSDLVEIDEDGRITAFHPYPHPPGAWLQNLVNAAFYAVDRAALEAWRDSPVPSDFAKDLFPAMVAAGVHLQGYRSYEYIKDLGTPSRLNEREFRVVLVTNQPVLARGECTPEELHRIHARLETELGQGGAWLDGLYVCPHHPHGGFPGEVASLKIDCDCRKPKTGLIDRACAELNIDRARSWMIGDSTGDILAAQRAGLRAVLVDTGERGRDGRYPVTPDFTAPDFTAAVALVCDVTPRLVAASADLLAAIGDGDLVLLGGPARLGKSTLAATLAAALREAGRTVRLVALDRWIRPAELREPGLRGRFDLEAALQALAPWLSGGAAAPALPVYDRVRRTTLAGPAVDLPADAVLILEGVPALLLAPATTRRVHRVAVTGDEAARHARVIADLQARGSDPVEAARIAAARSGDELPEVTAVTDSAQTVLNLDPVFQPSTQGDA
jgi:histidinol-phosphate phosphatase family protein